MGRGFLRGFFKENKDNRLTGSLQEIIDKILSRKLSDIKISSFLVFLKYHRSPYTFGKAIDVLRSKVEKVDLFLPDSVEVGYPYPMKEKSPYFMIASAVVLSLLPKSEIKAVFHGDNTGRSSTKDIFDYLGITLLTNEDSENMLKNLNIGFFNRALFLPSLSDLNGLREELNIKDLFSYTERFVNPVSSMYHVTGSGSLNVEFYKEILRDRYKRFGIVVGGGEFPDVVGRSKLIICTDEILKQYDIEIDDFRLEKKFSSKDHADFLTDLLGKKLPQYEKYLFINGAVLLLVRGFTDSIEEGYKITQDLFYSYDFSQILRNIQRYSDYLNYKNIYEI